MDKERTISMNRRDTGEVLRRVIALALPIAIQNIFSTAVSSADVLMSGRLGQNSLSAVSLAGQVTFVLNLILLGLTIGTGLIVAQYFGKGDMQTIGRIQAYAIRVTILVCAVFSVCAVLFPDAVMRIFTSDEILICEGVPYLKIVGISYIFTGFAQVAETVLKAVNRVRISSAIGTAAMIINVIFNAVFIFGLCGIPGFGVAGAAIGTLLARLIESALCLAAIRKGSVKICLSYLLHIDRDLQRRFWNYTLPITLNGFSWGSAFAAYSVILGHIGSDMVAANSIATIVRNFAMVGCNGLAGGAGIYLGALLGGGELGMAQNDAKVILKLTFVFGISGGLIVLLAAPFILRIAGTNVNVRSYLGVMLVINAFYIVTKAYNCVFNNGILSAGGDTGYGLICDTIDMWCYSVPLGFIAAFIWQLPPMAVYLLISTDELVKLPAYYHRYKKKNWIKNITKGEDHND